ncbi:serine/threonine protein kinase [Nocardioides jiangxiensis]|uniref:non-specific serine/threonine protein kinase n=1 Tax=Nocardioides jiangxiensis TaxID=3064524 RepID=A0ABT9AYF6_9ACTN|nr:protein kinase [Nocardioides sp. WY-20]MDO7866999.1 protein kinase [Nocardioides sp. WY-20]
MLEPGPGVVFGRYRMTGAPAYHGAGTVVEAVEVRTGQPRTLWLVMPHIVNEAGQREEVVRVARVLRRLDSDHVLRLHEFGEIDGQPFFASGSVAGAVDLTRVAEPDGIPPVDALELIAQVGAGIGHLHHAGLVDGALGPRRVLVAEREGRVVATLRDAGILPALLGTSALFGTQKQEALDYGAPELHHGGEPTVRADIYSLGCLLWLALTGRTPYPTYVGHRAAEVPQVAGDGAVEEAVNAVLRTALAKDPAARYRDVAALVGTLRAIATLARDGAAGALPERLVPLHDDAVPEVEASALAPEPGRPVPSDVAPEDPVARTVAAAGPVPAESHDSAEPEDPSVAEEPVAAPDVEEPALAKARAAFAAREAAVLSTSPTERSALAEVAAGWAPIESLRPPEEPEPKAAVDPGAAHPAAHVGNEESVEPAMRTAIDHWAAGRAVSRMRDRGAKRVKGAARGLSVAAVLGTLAVVSVWGVRHFKALDAGDANPAASSLPHASANGRVPSDDATKALARLFPIVGKDDCAKGSATMPHRRERWTCERNGYRVVLTHWDSQQHARQLVAHKGDGSPWSLRGERAGTQWTWHANDGSDRAFRWTAVYSDAPYAVSIEARNPARRDYGRTHVVVEPSTALG